MGSPQPPVLAYVFMEELEARAIENRSRKPTFYLKNVNDTFEIWNYGNKEADKLLNHPKSRQLAIKFITKIKKTNCNFS